MSSSDSKSTKPYNTTSRTEKILAIADAMRELRDVSGKPLFILKNEDTYANMKYVFLAPHMEIHGLTRFHCRASVSNTAGTSNNSEAKDASKVNTNGASNNDTFANNIRTD
jgi:hypothetical protein